MVPSEELAVIVRALRRSRARRAGFRALLEVRVASPEELAALAGVGRAHLVGAFLGAWPAYRPEFALVSFGLVERRGLPSGVAFAVTPKGEAVAAVLPARSLV